MASTPARSVPGRVAHLAGQPQVAVHAQVGDRGPGGGDRGGRPGAGRGRRAVQPAGPAVEQEVLLRQHPLVAVQQQRGALEAPAVLVDVGRQRGDARRPGSPRAGGARPAARGTAAASRRGRRRRGTAPPARPPGRPARGSGRPRRTGSTAPSPTTRAVRSSTAAAVAAASARPSAPDRHPHLGRRRGSGRPWRTPGGRWRAGRPWARRCRGPCGRGRGPPARPGTGSRCRRSSACPPRGLPWTRSAPMATTSRSMRSRLGKANGLR